MKQKTMHFLLWSTLLLVFLFFTGTSHASKTRLFANAETQKEVLSQKFSPIEELNEIQKNIMDTIDQNNPIFFGQIDRLIGVHGDLGTLIRDHATLTFQVTEDIEYIRFNLDTIISEHTAFQMRISEQIGNAQEELGRFIVTSQKEITGIDTTKVTQERLGQLILDSMILHKKLASDVAKMQIRFEQELKDHAGLLIRISQEMRRSGNPLEGTILNHAETLQSSKGEIMRRHHQLSDTMRKGAKAGEALFVRVVKPGSSSR